MLFRLFSAINEGFDALFCIVRHLALSLKNLLLNPPMRGDDTKFYLEFQGMLCKMKEDEQRGLLIVLANQVDRHRKYFYCVVLGLILQLLGLVGHYHASGLRFGVMFVVFAITFISAVYLRARVSMFCDMIEDLEFAISLNPRLFCDGKPPDKAFRVDEVFMDDIDDKII